VVQVLLRDTTPPREVPEMRYQVRKTVGDMRHLLPAGVQGPFLDDEYSDVYAAVFAITGTTDNAELVRQAEALRLRLLQLPNAGKVAIFGEQAQQVFVEISHNRLATLGVGPSAILDALARQNAVAPADVVETPSSRVHLRTDAGFDGLAAIRAVPVEAGGRTIRLGDIATIRRGTQDRPSPPSATPASPPCWSRSPSAGARTCWRWARSCARRWRRCGPSCPRASPSPRSPTSRRWWPRASASSC
jgi:multidrug efflux pump subunit AcrB